MAFFNIILSYILITLIGFVTGYILRIENNIKPLPTIIVFAWPKIAILGLIFSENTMTYY